MMASDAVDASLERLQAELRQELGTATTLVPPGELCHVCGQIPGVATVPLATTDPLSPRSLVMLDVVVCVGCHHKVAPRVVVRGPKSLMRRLIERSAVEVEAYPRALLNAKRPVRLAGA